MRTHLAALAGLLALGASTGLAATGPAAAQDEPDQVTRLAGTGQRSDSAVQSRNVKHLSSQPGQAAISGCFLSSAPLFVTSGLESVRVYDVSDPARPQLRGVLPNLVFENEAMSCGERRTASGTQRFVLIGVDLYDVSPGDVTHTNVGDSELIVVDVTDPTKPFIRSRTPGTTSTHTVACVEETDCAAAYSAGSSRARAFSIFDLSNLDAPREVDADAATAGTQPFASPTAGHKWNFDRAGFGTHTGFEGASMWRTRNPLRPRLVTTTGAAGRGEDPAAAGYNDFILHNSLRPHAERFRPNRKPSLRNGNVLLVTEEDYEQTDCAKAGSFQTWWVKRLDGTPDAIVPLDKVELADLGSFPSPRGAFCSSHWFDYRQGGLVAAGFYGGGTQVLDVRDPRDIKAYGHSVWGASEVWDAMWVPVYRDGKRTRKRTNVVYSLDLARGLDVYAVDVPGDGRGAVPPPARGGSASLGSVVAGGAVPVGLVSGAAVFAIAVRRRHRPLP